MGSVLLMLKKMCFDKNGFSFFFSSENIDQLSNIDMVISYDSVSIGTIWRVTCPLGSGQTTSQVVGSQSLGSLILRCFAGIIGRTLVRAQ
jgi:hypothetical protein